MTKVFVELPAFRATWKALALTDGDLWRLQEELLAPTAVNQQKFLFALEEDGRVSAQPGHAFYAKMDLGIAKYHFEVGAGKENVQWT